MRHGAARGSVLCPRPLRSQPGADLIGCFHLCVHFLILLVIMAVGDPATHVSTSMHQRYGPCGMVHVDITGAAGRIPDLLADVLVFESQIHFCCFDRK